MKKIILFTAGILLNTLVYAQWVDSGPNMTTNDNVGIGTTSLDPGFKLTVTNGINIGGEQNGSLKVRHVNGKDYKSANIDNLYLNYNTGKDVYVGHGGQNSNLFVSGQTGIGTTSLDGGSALTIAGSVNVMVDLR